MIGVKPWFCLDSPMVVDAIGMAELRLGACWALTPTIQVKKLHSEVKND